MRTTLVEPLSEQSSASLLQLLDQLPLLLLHGRLLLLVRLHLRARGGGCAAAGHVHGAQRLRQLRAGSVGGRWPHRCMTGPAPRQPPNFNHVPITLVRQEPVRDAEASTK
jgi:hypothetical protein